MSDLNFAVSRYILALDQGTSSSRALLFDRQGRVKAQSQKEFLQLYPRPGWVEHDPHEIWNSQFEVAREALAKAGAAGGDVAAIGIANQRETTLLWDRKTGKPVGNAIVWQDRRTAARCQRLREEGFEPLISDRRSTPPRWEPTVLTLALEFACRSPSPRSSIRSRSTR